MLKNKLKIIYGKDAESSGSASTATNSLKLDFNPTSYKRTFHNKYSCSQELHSPGKSLRYGMSQPGEISLTLLFDETGVNEFGAIHAVTEWTSSVKDKIEEFLNITTFPVGKEHAPQTLRLVWGNLDFRCKLTSVDINYKLFNRLGNPIRAEVNTTFTRHFIADEGKKKVNNSSPDVTHERILKAGETLPMLCHQIYGKPSYYIEVARANKLNDFRNLKPGTRITFPPLV